ncbi:DNA cytosine methyltransferase [Helicobacter pylori]
MEFTITSLFSGCGGLDLGFCGGFDFLNRYYAKNPFKIIYANDLDKNAVLTYQKNLNAHIECKDVKEVDFDKLMPTDIVLGGFPCQDFSFAGKRKGLKSERGRLYESMIRCVKDLKPKIFLAENVKGLLNIDNGNTFRKILDSFKDLGYMVNFACLKVSDFGVSQLRERVIMVGVNESYFEEPFNFKILKKSHAPFVYEILKDLENLTEGAMPNHFYSRAKRNKGQGNNAINKDTYAPTMRAEHHGNIEYHYNNHRRLSAREAARIQSFPDNFIFYPSTSSAYRQIGNAVPPVFAWHLAQGIKEFLYANIAQ